MMFQDFLAEGIGNNREFVAFNDRTEQTFGCPVRALAVLPRERPGSSRIALDRVECGLSEMIRPEQVAKNREGGREGRMMQRIPVLHAGSRRTWSCLKSYGPLVFHAGGLPLYR